MSVYKTEEQNATLTCLSTTRGFCGFSFNRESIPMNYGLINQQYKSTTATAKVLL